MGAIGCHRRRERQPPFEQLPKYLPRLPDVRPERIAPAIENGQKLRPDVLRVKTGRLGELSQVGALVMQGGVGALTILHRRQRQLRLTTSSGSESPLSVTARGAESVTPAGMVSTVSRLAMISPASASAAMRAATCTPLPR